MSSPLSVESALSAFPYVLGKDPHLAALARAVAEELLRLWDGNELLRLYARIDELDEPLLDLLAYDFKVDWYLYDGTLASKREQIKSHFDVHRHLGTKAAMERALRDLCPDSQVEEWFTYGGQPYHFKVTLDITHQTTPVTDAQIERLLGMFKSARDIYDAKVYNSRTFRRNVCFTHGGYVDVEGEGEPIDVERSASGAARVRGGAYTTTVINSRLIE